MNRRKFLASIGAAIAAPAIGMSLPGVSASCGVVECALPLYSTVVVRGPNIIHWVEMVRNEKGEWIGLRPWNIGRDG